MNKNIVIGIMAGVIAVMVFDVAVYYLVPLPFYDVTDEEMRVITIEVQNQCSGSIKNHGDSECQFFVIENLMSKKFLGLDITR